jgi:hypothetical protein
MGSRLLGRLRKPTTQPDLGAPRTRIEAVLARLPQHVASCSWVTLPAGGETWHDTAISLQAGQACTLIAEGMVHLSKAFDVGFKPQVGLWYRVGDGELAKIIGSASSFEAPVSGTLKLTTKPPGEFLDRAGRFHAEHARSGVSGAFRVAVIVWRTRAASALAEAAALDPDLFGPALRRQTTPLSPPEGWHYLWRLGQGEIFSSPDSGAPRELCCSTHADVGILQYPVERPLTPELRLDWSWCVDTLPSRLPEHIQPTHDYLSIAVEFDNGLDLTYMWSAALPVDTIFQCPLPWWNERETHWVVRSGTSELGRWLDESRPLAEDYRTAIGDVLPQRVVAVWLIANTVFQRGRGQCRYRNIRLRGAGGDAIVQP